MGIKMKISDKQIMLLMNCTRYYLSRLVHEEAPEGVITEVSSLLTQICEQQDDEVKDRGH